MKKILVIITAMALLFAFAACGEDDGGNSTGMPNPMTEYGSLAELNETYSVNLQKPETGEIKDEQFFGIATTQYNIAEYDFKMDGRECFLRGTADTYDDISGIYAGDNTIFYTEAQGEPEPDMSAATEELKAYRWFIGSKQYVLCVKDGGSMDPAEFEDLASAVKALTDDRVLPDLSAFTGSYEDSVSMRASMEVMDNGDGTLLMCVDWSNSAFDTEHWEMNAVYTPDGALYYTDGVHTHIDFSQNEEGEVTVLEEGQTGSFTVYDETGELAWLGAADDSCKELVFQKY